MIHVFKVCKYQTYYTVPVYTVYLIDKMFISSFEFTEHSKLKNFLTVVEVLATIGSIKTYCSKTYCINFMVNISVLKDIYNTKF